MSLAPAMSRRRGPRALFAQAYDYLMRYLSLNWPLLWRLRVDLLVVFGIVGFLLFPFLFDRFEPYSPTYAYVDIAATLLSLFFWIVWIMSVTRSARMREVIRYLGQPRFVWVFLALSSIAFWPLWLVEQFNMADQTAVNAKISSHPYLYYYLSAHVVAWRSTDIIICVVVIWIATVFSKLMSLSSVGLATGATLIGVGTGGVGLFCFLLLADQSHIPLQEISTWLIAGCVYLVPFLGIIGRDLLRGVQSRLSHLISLSLLWTAPVIFGLTAMAWDFRVGHPIGFDNNDIEGLVAAAIPVLVISEGLSWSIVRLSLLPTA